MKWLILPICVCALLFAGDGVTFEQGEHVTVRDGSVVLDRLPKFVFQDRFTDANWRICCNRNEAIALVHGERQGRRGLILSRKPGSNGDTAFELRSKAFEVEGKSEFRMSVFACGSWDIQMAAGAVIDENTEYEPVEDESHGFFNGLSLPRKYKDDRNAARSPMACRMVLRWLNGRGAEIGACPLEIKKLPEGMVVVFASGMVPSKAKYGQIVIGAESPDFGKDDYLMLLSAHYSARTSRLFPSGSFISMPFPMQEADREIIWEADTPGRSSVYVQMSSSPDAENWTPFSGAEQDVMRTFPEKGGAVPLYPADHKWLRYKVMLHSDGKNSPAFKSIKIGWLQEENWKGQDDASPEITMKTPARLEDPMSTLEFRVMDNAGVEWRTLEMRIDGRDVSAAVKRDGNLVSYTPKRPFSTKRLDFGIIEEWEFSNRNVLLDRKMLMDDVLRISRDGGRGDTFFELVSPAMPVFPFEQYVFSCEMRSNMDFLKNGPKHVQMTFFDKDMKFLGIGESMYFSPAPDWTVVKCTALAPIDAAFLVVRIAVEDPDIFEGRYVEFRKSALTGRINISEKQEPNLHIVSLKAADRSGNVCEGHFGVLFEKMSSDRIDLSDKGAILANGRRFIPVAMTNVWMRDKKDSDVFFDLRGAGFNMAVPLEVVSPEEVIGFAGNAMNAGVRTVIVLPDVNGGSILRNVAAMQSAAGVMGWLFADRTLNTRTPEELKELAAAIRGIAPGHLVFVKGHPDEEKMMEYAAAADVFMPVIGNGDDVCKVLSAAVKHGCRSIMPVFSVNKETTGLLERVCAALMCGGSGIAFDCSSSDVRGKVFEVAGQLHQIISIMTASDSGNAGYEVKGGGDVEPLFMSRRLGGKQYVVFCNRDSEAVEVTFKVEDCDEARMLLDGGRIVVEGREFKDMIEPGRLRIYELGRLFE